LTRCGKLLGHKEVRSKARYTHLDDAVVLRTADDVGTAIARLIEVEYAKRRHTNLGGVFSRLSLASDSFG